MGGKNLNGKRTNREDVQKLIIAFLQPVMEHISDVMICGSYRRGKPDVGDIDLVLTLADDKRAILGIELQRLYGVDALSKKKSCLYEGVQIEILETDLQHQGAMLLYATGPGEFNVEMRRLAKSKGMKLNQYGLWDVLTDKCYAAATEQEIFEALGLEFIHPHSRDAEAIKNHVKRT